MRGLSPDHQAASVSDSAASAPSFRSRGGVDQRHAVDPFGRPARARNAARHDAGRAHAAGHLLHADRREDRRQGLYRPARGGRAFQDGGDRRQAALRRAAARGHPDHRALSAAAAAPRAAREIPRPEALSARGPLDDGLGKPDARSARLPAPRFALCLRRRHRAAVVPRSVPPRFPSRRFRRVDALRAAGPGRRFAAAGAGRRALPARPRARGLRAPRNCEPIRRMSARRCTRWCRWSPTASA